jgi:hypothetical protein
MSIAGVVLERLLTFVALFVCVLACADEGAGVAVSYARQPPAAMTALGEGASIAAEEYQASVFLPPGTAGQWQIRAGLDYQYTHYDYVGVNSRDRDLHRLQLPVNFSSDNDVWRISGYVAPGIATSSNIFKDFLDRGSGDDWFVSARLEAGRNSGDKTWLAGLAYDRSFGKDRAYPVLGLAVEPAEDLVLRIAFPDSEVRWQPSDRQTLSGRVFPAGFVWRVVTDDFQDSFDYRTEGVRLQATWSYRFGSRMNIDVSIAHEIDRRHELYDDQLSPIVTDVEDEWLFMIGVRLGTSGVHCTNGVCLR